MGLSRGKKSDFSYSQDWHRVGGLERSYLVASGTSQISSGIRYWKKKKLAYL